jgi:hypothetical protein
VIKQFWAGVLVLTFIAFIIGCGQSVGGGGGGETTGPVTFTLASGSYEANMVIVTMECTYEGAAIYYTTDGSTPTTNSTPYTGNFSIESSVVMKAIAYRTGEATSSVSTAWYDLYWWQAVGGGLDDQVIDMVANDEGQIFVTGCFSYAGGVYARTIACWDGSTWQALGAGISVMGNCLELDGDGNVFVGGVLDTAGEISVNNIA